MWTFLFGLYPFEKGSDWGLQFLRSTMSFQYRYLYKHLHIGFWLYANTISFFEYVLIAIGGEGSFSFLSKL